jgi:hypothetical protein
MAGNEKTAEWIVEKLCDEADLAGTKSLGDGFLQVARKGKAPFTAVATRLSGVIELSNVKPLFKVKGQKPEFVVNVPSRTIWSGKAIEFIHEAPAAFGTLGDLSRASRKSPPSDYRNKEYAFFERAFRQHSAVEDVTRLFDRKFKLERFGDLPDITVVLLDAYDVSAEDIRNARDRYGKYDVALKMTSYGSVTSAAIAAAEAMDAEALTLKELMGRLRKK